MFKTLVELYSLLTHEQRRAFLRLQLLIIAMAIFEVLGVMSIGPFMGLVDPYLLGQVLRGLLSNAIRYSPAGGTITLALRDDPR